MNKDKRTFLQRLFWFRKSKNFNHLEGIFGADEWKEKLTEEKGELLEAMEEGSREHILEEALDVIQVVIGILVSHYKVDRKEFKRAIKIHNTKLMNRGWNFLETILK